MQMMHKKGFLSSFEALFFYPLSSFSLPCLPSPPLPVPFLSTTTVPFLLFLPLPSLTQTPRDSFIAGNEHSHVSDEWKKGKRRGLH